MTAVYTSKYTWQLWLNIYDKCKWLKVFSNQISSKLDTQPHQFQGLGVSSVAQSCPTLYDPMNRSTPGLPVHHQLLEFTETHIHRVGDAIQPSHLLLSPSSPAPSSSQHQSLFQWANPLHEEAKVLEFWCKAM